MKTLYLIRHAKSSWSDPTLRDFERPLNKRGKRDAPFMAEQLKRKGVVPDLIISSPAVRAKKTANQFAKTLGYPKKEIDFKPAIYDADEDDLLTILQAIQASRHSVLLFGHNPEFTEVANLLANIQIDNVPTTGIVAIQFEVKEWNQLKFGMGTLLFFDYPKKYKQNPL